MDAGAGDDEIVGGDGAGDDTYLGGDGIDTVRYTSAIDTITVDLAAGTASGVDIGNDVLTGIENIIGGQAGDVLTGDAKDNAIEGFSGNDTIYGSGGTDSAVYRGARSEYSVTSNTDGSHTVTDSVAGRDGVDRLFSIGTVILGLLAAVVVIDQMERGGVLNRLAAVATFVIMLVIRPIRIQGGIGQQGKAGKGGKQQILHRLFYRTKKLNTG